MKLERQVETFKLNIVCVCVCVCEAVWLSHFCKLQWAAGLAASVCPCGLKGECWLSCFVIQMPNVPPAKQLPPVPVLHRAALSPSSSSFLVLSLSFSRSLLFKAPFLSFSYFLSLSLFIVVLSPSVLSHIYIFLLFIYLHRDSLLWPCRIVYRCFLVLWVISGISLSFYLLFFVSYITTFPQDKKIGQNMWGKYNLNVMRRQSTFTLFAVFFFREL